MISVDASTVMKELEEYLKETTRKLEHMVRGFAYQISQTAIENTPLGDANKYFELYQSREEYAGLEPVEGFARGSWQVSKTGQFVFQEYYTANSGDKALSLIKTSLGLYKLGQNLYIGNNAYYIDSLENGSSKEKAPLGIMQPTVDNILKSYQVDLKRLYNEG